MNNKVNIRLSVQASSSGAGVSISKRFSSMLSGDSVAHRNQNVGTSWETLTHSADMDNLKYIYIKNLDAANFVLVGDAADKEHFKLKAGEFCMFGCLGVGDVRVKADTSSCLVEYAMLGDKHANKFWFRNEEEDNLLITGIGTEITVSAIDTVANTITLSWLPMIRSIVDPTAGQEWAVMNTENIAGADPSRTGDYTEGVTITGGDLSTRVLTYTNARGNEADWDVGDKVVLFNVYKSFWSAGSDPCLVAVSGAGWRSNDVAPGPLFQHSDGRWIMLVNGIGPDGYSIGAFDTDDLDSETWAVMNSDAAVFVKGGSDWRSSQIFASGAVHTLEDGTYMVFASGNNGSKWSIGWIKFDEDFDNISYAETEILDSSDSSNGFIAPSVVLFNDLYYLFFTDRSDNANPDLATDGWKFKYATSRNINGVYVVQDTIFKGQTALEGLHRCDYIDNCFAYVFEGSIYVLTGGTSNYKASGTRGNRCYGAFKFDAGVCVEDKRGLVVPARFYGNDFWSFTWGYDHLGGYPCVIRYKGTTYLFASSKLGGEYAILGFKTRDINFPQEIV